MYDSSVYTIEVFMIFILGQGFVLKTQVSRRSLTQGWQVYGVVTIFSEVLQVQTADSRGERESEQIL